MLDSQRMCSPESFGWRYKTLIKTILPLSEDTLLCVQKKSKPKDLKKGEMWGLTAEPTGR